MQYIKYRFKILLGQKVSIFWSLVFPIIMTSLFSLAFKNLMPDTNIDMRPIAIAVVSAENDPHLSELLDTVTLNDNKIFEVTYTDEAKAHQLLTSQTVSAIVDVETPPRLTFYNNDLETTIVKSVIDSYVQTGSAIQTIYRLKGDQTVFPTSVANQFQTVDTRDQIGNVWLFPYISAIGMGTFYGAYYALRLVNANNPSVEASGARLCIAPYNRRKMAVIDIILVTVVSTLTALIIYGHINYVLKVDISGHLFSVIAILALLGSIASCIGYVVGLVFARCRLSVSINIITFVSMIFSFMTGMMAPHIKLFIEMHLPFLQRINPIYLITDTLYYLHFHMIEGAEEIVSRNFINMGLIVCVLGITTILMLGRKKYDRV